MVSNLKNSNFNNSFVDHSQDQENNLLSVVNLTVKYKAYGRETIALNNVSLRVRKSEIVAVVGESGSGKSTLGLSILRLLPSPSAEYVGGQIIYGDSDLLKLDESAMTSFRGTKIS